MSSDGEIIVFYLRKKIDYQPLPPNKIIEVNLYAYDPDELAARYEPSGNGEWFYFTPTDRKYQNGHSPNRSSFYRGSASHGVKTNWMMHEFRVAEPPKPPRRSGVNDMRLDGCVQCRVYRKGERISERSRYESRLDESSSSSSSSPKIPRLELNHNPNKANNP
ncbi:hypothetical protein AAG906_041100 [Vitis piasezkii]